MYDAVVLQIMGFIAGLLVIIKVTSWGHDRWISRRLSATRIVSLWEAVIANALFHSENPKDTLAQFTLFCAWFADFTGHHETTLNDVLARFTFLSGEFERTGKVPGLNLYLGHLYTRVFVEWIDVDPKCRSDVLLTSLRTAINIHKQTLAQWPSYGARL